MLGLLKGGRRAGRSEEGSEAQMVLLLRPLLRVGRWFGVFPLEVDVGNAERALFQRRASLNYVRSLLILAVTSAYLLFHLTSIGISVSRKASVVEIIGQSLWFHSSIISYLVSLQLLFQPQFLINLFTKDWRAVERDCGRVFSAPKVQRFIRNCFLLYVVLASFSVGLIGFHSWQLPLYPAYVLHYVYFYTAGSGNGTTDDVPNWQSESHDFSTATLAVHTACQMWILCWKWAGLAILDVSLSLYGFVICEAMRGTLKNGVGESPGTETAVVIIAEVETPRKGRMSRHRSSLEPGRRQASKEKVVVLLEEFQTLSQLVGDVNRAMGPLILVNFGQMILMICALIFLPVKYSQHFEWNSTLLFAGNSVVFIVRLILLTICLGDVYPTGIDVNMRIANFMISQPSELSPELFNPILGHLSVFSANPISFTAWGFFPITRGTLLASLSLISTYIVVLLQVK